MYTQAPPTRTNRPHAHSRAVDAGQDGLCRWFFGGTPPPAYRDDPEADAGTSGVKGLPPAAKTPSGSRQQWPRSSVFSTLNPGDNT